MTPTHKPLTALHVRPAIETSLFDFFKIGPGPSSSHTIGPMRAGHDFVQRCDALDPDLVRRAARIHVVLLGSLSATGMGHGTNTAVLAGWLNPGILDIIESLSGPVIAMILFIMPMYAVHKIPAMSRYRGQWSNAFVLAAGCVAISSLLYKLF